MIGAGVVAAGLIASLQIDTTIQPLSFNGTKISFPYTDNNSGEDLIINTDQATYSSWDSAYVYFAIKNTSNTDQTVKIQFAYAAGAQTSKVEEFMSQVPYEVQVNDYADKETCNTVTLAGKDNQVCAKAIIGTHTVTNYVDKWGPLTEKQAENLKQLDQKPLPSKITARDQTDYFIPSGATRYFRSKMSFVNKTNGEFFINAYGSNGSYGTLDPSWYSSGWAYRRAITIDHTKVPTSDQTNFPVDIDITDAGLQANAQSNGNDILFTSADGTTKLDHEIEIYTSATGRLTGWVRVPTLSTTVDTVIYMYYGNPAASNQQNATGVWDTNFKIVYHMKDGTSLSPNDSTSNAKNASGVTATASSTGKIDGAADFNGSQDFPPPNTIGISGGTARTFSVWAKRTSNSVVIDSFLGNFTTVNETGWNIYTNVISAGDIYVAFLNNDYYTIAGELPNDGLYHLVEVIYDGGVISALTVHVNIDGSNRSLTKAGTGTGAANTTDGAGWDIGNDKSGSSRFYIGALDEVRISNTNRAQSWISTEYNNQVATSTFYTLGTQENLITNAYKALIDQGYQMIIPVETKILIQ